MTFYGVWCKDTGPSRDRGDWLRETRGGDGIIVFSSVRSAQRRAATEYGFSTYSEAKRKDWVEVRPLVTRGA